MSTVSTPFTHFSVTPIYAYSDNYIWCIHNKTQAWVVDPGDHKVVEAFLSKQHLDLVGILITHHHWDHTTGIKSLIETRDIPVYGPEHPKVPEITHLVKEGDQVTLFNHPFEVIGVSGHTLDHVAYVNKGVSNNTQDHPLVFCGDTLFSAGCGRLFEGTPAQMYDALQKLAQLDDNTLVFCTHEYTLSNLKFALAVEPENTGIQAEIQRVQALNLSEQPSLPTSIAKEKAINPFIRSSLPQIRQKLTETQNIPADTLNEIECFAAVRRWKDNF
ncbi:hydroxyacylglutathione hydrolase [Litoribrevibacter euphylliae]|uniref:Hydroxyacylglutathione hydrolase n=1 Tax=Litoribrevibacter euphylliae TaxID=1834034 RepID=A0ABV7HF59_9GAMM